MKAIGRYFLNRGKSALKPLLYFSVIGLVFCLSIALTRQAVEGTFFNVETRENEPRISYHATLYAPVLILCFLCYIVPVQQFSIFKKRRNLDCLYATPVPRCGIALVHYVLGWLLVMIPFCLCYLANWLSIMSQSHGYFLKRIPPHFFLCLLLGTVTYTFFVFVFHQANTTADGCVFLFLYSFLFVYFSEAAKQVFINFHTLTNTMDWKVYYKWSTLYGFPWGSLAEITDIYETLVIGREWRNVFALEEKALHIGIAFWVIVGALSLAGLLLTFGKRRTEKAEEVSDSWFGYRVLIPLLASCLIISAELSFLTVIGLAMVGYTVYRRGFHYKKSDWIMLALLLSLGIVVWLLNELYLPSLRA